MPLVQPGLFGTDAPVIVFTPRVLTFVVPGHPVSFQTTRDGVAKNTGQRWRFDPKEYKAYKEAIQQRAYDATRAFNPPGRWTLIDGPVQLRIVALFLRPKYLNKDARPRVLKKSKPDNSNLAKAVEDGCNRIVWTDDARVAISITEKWYGAPLEPEGLYVEVKELEE